MTDEEWVKRFVALKQEALGLICASLEQVPGEPCTQADRAQIDQRLREISTALWKSDRRLSGGESASPRVVEWMDSLLKMAQVPAAADDIAQLLLAGRPEPARTVSIESLAAAITSAIYHFLSGWCELCVADIQDDLSAKRRPPP